MQLTPVPHQLVEKSLVEKAYHAVVHKWDGKLDNFEEFAASVESFVQRNHPILCQPEMVQLVSMSLPIKYQQEISASDYADLLNNLREKIMPQEALHARVEFAHLQPQGIDPFQPELVRTALSKHHNTFYKSMLPDSQGLCGLRDFLPQHVLVDVQQRLWGHKKPVSYNFVRDLALNLLKNEPQERVVNNGDLPNSNAVSSNPRSQFTLLPHNPPYYAFDMPARREHESMSCFENRKRQLIESRERKGICGYCLSTSHGYYECKLRQEFQAGHSSAVNKRANEDDYFQPPVKKAKV